MSAAIPPLEPQEKALEARLQSLRPLAASSDLKRRIRLAAKDLPEDAPEPAAPSSSVIIPLHPAWLASAAAVIALAITLPWMWNSSSEPGTIAELPSPSAPGSIHPGGDAHEGIRLWDEPPSASGDFPQSSSDPNQMLIGHHDEGIIQNPEGLPMRKIRYFLMIEVETTNPETGETESRFVPQEHILVVPVEHD